MTERVHLVVRNDEDQYSIWPADLDMPAGWHPTGFTGSADACAAHVDEVWTDMRPRSLRAAMAAPPGPVGPPGDPADRDGEGRDVGDRAGEGRDGAGRAVPR